MTTKPTDDTWKQTRNSATTSTGEQFCPSNVAFSFLLWCRAKTRERGWQRRIAFNTTQRHWHFYFGKTLEYLPASCWLFERFGMKQNSYVPLTRPFWFPTEPRLLVRSVKTTASLHDDDGEQPNLLVNCSDGIYSRLSKGTCFQTKHILYGFCLTALLVVMVSTEGHIIERVQGEWDAWQSWSKF